MASRFFRSRDARRAHRIARAPGRPRLIRALRAGPAAHRVAVAVATAGGIGFLPWGGALGAVAGALGAWALPSDPGISWLALAAVVLAGTLATRVAIGVAGVEDPGECVVDEVAGGWLACLASGLKGPWLALPAILFVILDTVKPWPANVLEDRPGAVGVMADDLAAGAWAALIARILGVLLPG